MLGLVTTLAVALGLTSLLITLYVRRNRWGLAPFLVFLGALEVAVITASRAGQMQLNGQTLSVDTGSFIFLPALLVCLFAFVISERITISQQLLAGVVLLGLVGIGVDFYIQLGSHALSLALLNGMSLSGELHLIALVPALLLALALARLARPLVRWLPLQAGIGAAFGLAAASEFAHLMLHWLLNESASFATPALAGLSGLLCATVAVWMIQARGGLRTPRVPSCRELLDWRQQAHARLEGLVVSTQRAPTSTELLAQGVALTDLEGKLVYINPALEHLLEHSEPELLGRDIHDFIRPDALETLNRGVASLLQEDSEHVILTLPVQLPGQDLKWFECSLVVVPDDAGRPRYNLWLIEDVTRQQELNAGMLQANRELTLLGDFLLPLLDQGNRSELIQTAVEQIRFRLGAAVAGFYQVDWLDGSLSLEYELGHDPKVLEELHHLRLGRGFNGWVAATSTPLVVSDLRKHPHTPSPVLEGTGVLCYAGAPCTYQGKCAGVLFVGGDKPGAFDRFSINFLQRLGALLGALLHQASARESLEKAERELARFTDEAPYALLLLNADLKVRLCNTRMAGMLGRSAENSPTSSSQLSGPPALVEVITRLVHKAHPGEAPLVEEYTDEQGNPWRVQCSCFLNEQNQRDYTLVCLPPRKSEGPEPAELQQLQRFATLGLFSASIAHDVNNLLGPLQLRLEMLRTNTGNLDSLQEDTTEALQCVEDLAQLMKRVVGVARSKEFTAEPVELWEVLEAVQSLFSTEARHRNVQVSVEVPDDLPPVLAQPAALQEALLNIVSNALASMPEGGKLHFSATGDEAEVRLAIADTGAGLAPEAGGNLREADFVPQQPGSASLGLSLAASLIQQLGGGFEVTSEPGQGTQVTLTLPVAPAIESSSA